MFAGFSDPFEALLALQRALDARVASDWIGRGTAAIGSFPPINIFQKDGDLVAVVETPEALTVVLEMPGVDRNSIEANVEDDIVTIEGRIDFSKYEGMQPVYTEYNVGHYARSFQISNKVDQSKISAQMKDGVVTIVLPKAEQAKPRKIQVS